MFFYYYVKLVCYCRKRSSQGKPVGAARAEVLILLCVQMRQEVFKLSSHRNVALAIRFGVFLNILTPN